MGRKYGMSMWEELTFRDCKSGGWQCRKSRVWNRRRIPFALKLPTGLRAAKEAQGGKPIKGEGDPLVGICA